MLTRSKWTATVLLAFSLLAFNLQAPSFAQSCRIDIVSQKSKNINASDCPEVKEQTVINNPKVSYEATLPTAERVAKSLTLSFRNEMQKMLNHAYDYIKKQPVSYFDRSKAAVVLDLDETLMDNRAYFLKYGDYDPKLWAEWETEEEAAGIPETLNFVRWLNKKGYSVYFISGRKESHRNHTVNNLRKMGVTQYAGLYLKPDDYNKDSASNYKIDARKDIEAKGHTILATIGDQNSDIAGGYGKGFKLPNSIYYIP